MSNSKPWNSQDMIQNASSWTLAGDVNLLGYLESFSEDLLAKAEATNDNLNKLTGNLNNTSLSLDIVKKEFFSLHNTQFVESRVYEDDYSETTNGQEHNIEEKSVEEDKIDWKEAILKGIHVVNNYFDKVEVPGSDSEDETDFPSYILQPKDQYVDRRLPYVIGSEQWHKKWHVGLLDSSSESEEEKVVEKFSESDSDDLDINNRFKSEQQSDTSHNVTAKIPVANSTLEDIINNSDLFASNNSEENNNSVPIQAPVSTNNFAHELARKLGHVIEQNPNVVEPEVNRKPIQTSRISRTIGNLFDDEPPPLNDDDDIFASSIQKGLFSGGSGLFDDIPAEDESWNKNKTQDNQSKDQVSKSKLPDLFSDDNDDIFSNTGMSTGMKTTSKPKLSQIKKSSSDLFDDVGLDDDDDDDLFNNIASSVHKKSYLPSKNASTVPFFDSEPPELSLSAATAKPEQKKPAGGIKVFGNVDVLPQHKLEKPKIPNEHSIKTVDIKDISPDQNIPIKKTPSGLFDDFHSGSINNEKVSKTSDKEKSEPQEVDNKNTSNISIMPHTKPIDLFDDEDIFGDDLFSNVSTKKFTSDLFSDDIVNDNLLAQNSNKLFHEDLGFLSPKKSVSEESEKVPDSSNISVNQDDSETFNTSNISKPNLDLQTSDGLNVNNANKTKNLSININLFDQNPPDLLDDGWDSKSDNLFDDNENLFDSTSVVTGYRSGLFDDEPPSLFSESSGIVRDISCTRVETDDSFNPFASSSRRFSSEIFNEQQSNDSFFITKNKSNIEHRTQSNLDRIPEVTTSADSYSNLDVTPSGNVNNLFSDFISQQSNIEQDSFLTEKPSFENMESVKNDMDVSQINISKTLSMNADQNLIFESTDFDQNLPEQKDEIKEVFAKRPSDDNANVEVPTASSDVVDKSISKDDFASKIGSPGKLKHNLNINVNALKPGSGIITKKHMNRTNSLDADISKEKDTQADIVQDKDVLHDDKQVQLSKKTVADEEESQMLSNITKDRAKIPVKRRPSTRKARQEALRNSIADFRIHSLDANSVEKIKPLNKDEEEILPGSTTVEQIAPAEIFENKSDIISKTNTNNLTKSLTSSNLFDDPEEFDDLFSSIKLPPKSTILKQSLFDDENDDDDIFGSSSGIHVKSKSLSTSKTETKKPPKTAQITKLENTAVIEDPLSLFQE